MGREERCKEDEKRRKRVGEQPEVVIIYIL
jgi:hypothetical protein